MRRTAKKTIKFLVVMIIAAVSGDLGASRIKSSPPFASAAGPLPQPAAISMTSESSPVMGQYHYPAWLVPPSLEWVICNKTPCNWLKPKQTINGRVTEVFGWPGVIDLANRAKVIGMTGKTKYFLSLLPTPVRQPPASGRYRDG